MSVKRKAKGKGKKQSLEHVPSDRSSSSLSPAPPSEIVTPSVKKPRRAVTKECPVCAEKIPVRLLAQHCDLERERVEDIIKTIGNTVDDTFDQFEGSGGRKSAARARKSLSALSALTSIGSSTQLVSKTIHIIKRHRKQRNAKLRELTRDEGDLAKPNGNPGVSGPLVGRVEEFVCPVCLECLRADDDDVEAHVDACLAHECSRLEAERLAATEAWDEVEVGGHTSLRIGNAEILRGAGFHVRGGNERDVDADVDVDGDDEVVFGGAQFTEGDILGLPEDGFRQPEDLNVDIDGEDDSVPLSLQDLVAKSRMLEAKMAEDGQRTNHLPLGTRKWDNAIFEARRRLDSSLLVVALEGKIQDMTQQADKISTIMCRICLDPYLEPTVSTGCWHTCCKECWLRCLGSTKLCPICKRITAAGDLRRIYL